MVPDQSGQGPKGPSAADSNATIDAVLETVGRSHTPLRWTFVQQGSLRDPRPGPLQDLVTRRAHRTLLLYLLAVAKASSEPWDTSLPSAVWARALGMKHPQSQAAGVTISRAWQRLAEQNLVRRGRTGRIARIHLLREDGSGDEYLHPGKVGDRYLQLSNALWTTGPGADRWYRALSLPEISMLLIALSLKNPFRLPSKRVPDWYGISAATATRGLGGLVGRGLLTVEQRFMDTPLSPTGYTAANSYTLQAPFEPKRSKPPKNQTPPDG